MNERQNLYQQIKEYEKYLDKLRLKWFIGIWLGYSAVILWLLCSRGIPSIFVFAQSLIIALVLGCVCYWVNLAIWSNCCDNLDTKSKYLKELENKYNEIVQKGR